jgi:uncharacterized delta-60 repeat protein
MKRSSHNVSRLTLDRLDDRLTPTNVVAPPDLLSVRSYPLPVGEFSPFARTITLPDGNVIQVDTRTRGDLAPLTPFVRTAAGPNGSVVFVDSRADGDLTVSRLNPDGSYDTNFAGDGKVEIRLSDLPEFQSATPSLFDASAVQVAVGADGSTVLAMAGVGNTGEAKQLLVRLTPSGTLDSAFDGDGVRLLNDIVAPVPGGFGPTQLDGLSVLPDGDILGLIPEMSVPMVITDFNAPFPSPTILPGKLLRFTPTGQLDQTFGTSGVAELPVSGTNSRLVGSERLVPMPDGSTLLVSGLSRENDFYGDGSFNFTFFDTVATRYDANGKLDPELRHERPAAHPQWRTTIAHHHRRRPAGRWWRSAHHGRSGLLRPG